MTARPWPVEHARAWLLREAARLLDTDPQVGECVASYLGRAGANEWKSQFAFDAYLHDALSLTQPEIDRAVAEVYAAAEAIPPDMQKPHQSALVAELVKEFEAFDAAIDAAQRQCHNCQQWTSAELDPINEARHRFYVAAEAVTHDPIDDLLEKLAEEARAVPEGNTFHGGGLDGAPIFDAYRFAEKTIRRLTGKEAR